MTKEIFQPRSMLMFQARWGYRKENCRTGKIDILASSLQSCSFLTANTSSRCSPSKSAALANGSSNIGLLAQSLIDTYEEECPSNCEYLRFYRFNLNFYFSLSAQVHCVPKHLQSVRLSEAGVAGLSHLQWGSQCNRSQVQRESKMILTKCVLGFP